MIDTPLALPDLRRSATLAHSMPRLLPILLLLLTCLLLPVPGRLARAEEDEPARALEGEELREQVRQWIADLRSDQYEVREAAREGLRTHGLKARDLLEAAQDDEDPEVRRTVRALLSGQPRPPVRIPMQVQDGKLQELGLVTLELEDAPLGQALDELGRQMGAHFEVPEEARSHRVTVQERDAPCFHVLRGLLAAGGLRMPKSFDAAGSVTLAPAGEEPVPPWAAAGPVLVEVVSVTATRTLDAVKPPRFALSLRVVWAPLVHIGQYEQPRPEVARGSLGGVFKAASDSRRSVRYGVGQYTRTASVQVHLEPTGPKDDPVLAVLELVLPIASLQHRRAEVRLRDTGRIPICLGPDGEPAEPDTDEAVQFQALDLSEDGRSQWVADITATLLDPVPQRTVQAFTADADGRLERLQIYGGRSRAADGTVRLTARGWRSGADKPEGLVVTWFRREDGGSLRFRLTDIPLR